MESALPDLPLHYFDCIIFNDVLEYLVDPYSMLIKMQDLLSKTGVVVASIPKLGTGLSSLITHCAVTGTM